MPFKDIATADSIFLRKVPPSSDSDARTALRRSAKVSVGLIAAAEGLEKDPLSNAIALMSLTDAIAKNGALLTRAIRLAVTVNGDEGDDTLKQLKDFDPAMIFLNIAPHVSTLHASRLVFELIKSEGFETSVIHHYQTGDDDSNDLALEIGTRIGSLLVDGLGDGVMVEEVGGQNTFILDFLIKASFSLLQGCCRRSTKTEFVSCPFCGRTLFGLQETTAKSTEETGHLPGVTVAT